MSKRNLWTNEESAAMLAIFNEKECLKRFDGKKYRNTEIYKLVENELKEQGFESKNAKQIEVRWKNLKCQYITAKKGNARSGHCKQTCPFYEELDKMLNFRPSVTLNFGIDSSIDNSSEYNNNNNDINVSQENNTSILNVSQSLEHEHDDEIEIIEHKTSDSKLKKDSLKTGKGSHSRNVTMLSEKIKQTERDLNEDFLKKQKELIDYEFKLYSNKENENYKNFEKLVEDNTKNFLKGLEKIFESQENNKANTATFFSTWTPNES